jgi:hypothetical protein
MSQQKKLMIKQKCALPEDPAERISSYVIRTAPSQQTEADETIQHHRSRLVST